MSGCNVAGLSGRSKWQSQKWKVKVKGQNCTRQGEKKKQILCQVRKSKANQLNRDEDNHKHSCSSKKEKDKESYYEPSSLLHIVIIIIIQYLHTYTHVHNQTTRNSVCVPKKRKKHTQRERGQKLPRFFSPSSSVGVCDLCVQLQKGKN